MHNTRVGSALDAREYACILARVCWESRHTMESDAALRILEEGLLRKRTWL